MKSVVENAQYVTLALLIIAQCVVGGNFYLGQGIYLAANAISVFRCFALERPAADKVKDIACTAVTIGLIVFNFLK